LGAALPQFQRLQKEGESGQQKLNQYTRYLAVAITVAQSSGYLVNLQSQYGSAIPAGNTWFWITSVFCLTAGTMFLVYLGERITEKGIGNGISLIIAIGIVAELPGALISEFQANSLMLFYIELVALGVVTMAVILLTTGTRKIPVNYARAMMGNRMIGMTQQVQPRQYIPLKINAAGVMPIIFAQSIMFIPATVATFFQDSDFWIGAGNFLSNYQSFGYNAIFVTLIILFTYFYTAIVYNPNQIAEDIKKNQGFIPGVKPGKKTAEFIDTILTRVTLPGSIFLAFVAVLPAIVGSLGMSNNFAQFFGGTTLLIMIGVVLDTLQQIESYLLNRHYDGLMKTGRVRGRNPRTTSPA
jgi:preprotein translocase subunit SecY